MLRCCHRVGLGCLGFFGGFHSFSGRPARNAHHRSRSFLSGITFELESGM